MISDSATSLNMPYSAFLEALRTTSSFSSSTDKIPQQGIARSLASSTRCGGIAIQKQSTYWVYSAILSSCSKSDRDTLISIPCSFICLGCSVVSVSATNASILLAFRVPCEYLVFRYPSLLFNWLSYPMPVYFKSCSYIKCSYFLLIGFSARYF